MSITIHHSAGEGTILTGDPRPHHQLVKDAGFRWSGRQQFWYSPHSRDKRPDTLRISNLAQRLEGAGFTVEIDVHDDVRSAAEREADRAERLAERQDRLDTKADRLGATAEALHDRARDMASVIPFGQPILVGHYSERRDRNYRGKIRRTFERSFETAKEADETARRAEASRATQEHRESGPATIRRIERLEAEARDIGRKLKPCPTSGRKMKPEAKGRSVECPRCFHEQTVTNGVFPTHGAANDEWAERLRGRLEEINGDIAYWRSHLESLKANGFRQWGPTDFKKGDRVRANGHPGTVERVNKKSLSVRVDVMPHYARPIPYDEITPMDKERATP